MVIKKHLMGEAAGLTLPGHRDDLAAFGVVAEVPVESGMRMNS
jgi:hypothetical protein